MTINSRVLKMLENTGLTYKEAEELANRFYQAFESLPTVRELANRIYANLKYWRENEPTEIILEKIEKHHRGKENAIKRKTLLGGINCVYRLELTDRELRNIYCQLPVISSSDGIFWPIRKEELDEFQVYLKKKALPLFNRYKMVAEHHQHLMEDGDSIQWNLF